MDRSLMHEPRCRRQRHGAAMVEAVMALPLLIIVLLAVPYVSSLLAAHQRTLALARTEAWTAAIAACVETVPAPAAMDGESLADQARDRTQGAHGNTRYSSALEVPVVGGALAQFVPRSIHRTRNRDVARPKLFSVLDESDAVQSHVDLVCNEPTQDPLDAALELLRSFL